MGFILGLLGNLGIKVLLDHRDHLDLQDLQVKREILVERVQLVLLLVHLVLQDNQGFLVYQAQKDLLLASQEPLVLLDFWDPLGCLEIRVLKGNQVFQG